LTAAGLLMEAARVSKQPEGRFFHTFRPPQKP